MDRSIPLYSNVGAILDFIDQRRLTRLLDLGRVARVVHSRNGNVRRVVLHRMPGEPRPTDRGAKVWNSWCDDNALDEVVHQSEVHVRSRLLDSRREDQMRSESPLRKSFVYR